MNQLEQDIEQRAHAKGLKMHLRAVSVHGSTFRVATLRASTHARFSTNYFHDTWHVLTDDEGAQLLARMLWALSFQRLPGTCVLIAGAHLVPTPFEADPALPVLLMQDGLTRADVDAIATLDKRLRDDSPGTTIRFHTFGMPEKLRERESSNPPFMRYHEEKKHLYAREKMQRIGRFIVYSAPPEILREQALSIHGMHGGKYADYHNLAECTGRRWTHSPPGEVQVFARFKDMVSAAQVARREVIGTEVAAHLLTDDDERRHVQRRAELARARLDQARRHSPT